jgi:hypothetical protein
MLSRLGEHLAKSGEYFPNMGEGSANRGEYFPKSGEQFPKAANARYCGRSMRKISETCSVQSDSSPDREIALFALFTVM